jgi:hypothetical protein
LIPETRLPEAADEALPVDIPDGLERMIDRTFYLTFIKKDI